MEPDKRPTAEQILNHNFLMNHGVKMTRSIDEESENINDSTKNSLMKA